MSRSLHSPFRQHRIQDSRIIMTVDNKFYCQSRLCLSLLLWIFLLSFIQISTAVVIHLRDYGIVPHDSSSNVMRQNTQLFSKLLEMEGSSNIIKIDANETYYFRHGIAATYLHDSILHIDGTLKFVRDSSETLHRDELTHQIDTVAGTSHAERPSACIFLLKAQNVTFTSTHREGLKRGYIHGGGQDWWGIPLWGYLRLQEHRPVLLEMIASTNVVIENLVFQDAPFWTMNLRGMENLVVRHTSVVSRRTKNLKHQLFDLSAFNTDGIDVSGHNIHVHDVDIWNQDDCISVKGNDYGGWQYDEIDGISSNMVFERIHASGLGLVIGSIGDSIVRNITFKDSFLMSTFKGIYMKFKKESTNAKQRGIIEDITYQNITMESPKQWGIWIGPSQQTGGSRNLCAADPCSLCWPTVPFSTCRASKNSYKNIVLKDITINNPKQSPGVVIGSKDNPIDSIVFDNVVITQGPTLMKFEDRFKFFPGLQEPWHTDKFVRETVSWLYAVIGLVIVAIGLFCCYIPASRQKRESALAYRHEPLPQSHQEDDFVKYQNTSPAIHAASNSVIPPLPPRRQLRQRTWSEEKRIKFEGNPKPSFVDDYCCYSSGLMLKFGKFFVVFLLIYLSWMLFGTKQVRNLNKYFMCHGVINGIARGNTWPIPTCFSDETVGDKRASFFRLYPSNAEYAFILVFLVLIILGYIAGAFIGWHKIATEASRVTVGQQQQFMKGNGRKRRPSMGLIAEEESFENMDNDHLATLFDDASGDSTESDEKGTLVADLYT